MTYQETSDMAEKRLGVPATSTKPMRSYLYKRHSLPVRIMHWLNVLSLTILLMSGLMIFNAHPSLDWGKQSYSGNPSVMTIASKAGANGQLQGVTTVLGSEFNTTGLLGVSADANGRPTDVAFPRWMTIPGDYSLAEARLWHFFFAWLLVLNGAIFVLYGWRSRHLVRDLWPTRADWRSMGKSIKAAYKPNLEHSKIYDALFAEYKILHDYFGRGANDTMKRLKAIRNQSKKL